MRKVKRISEAARSAETGAEAFGFSIISDKRAENLNAVAGQRALGSRSHVLRVSGKLHNHNRVRESSEAHAACAPRALGSPGTLFA